jgi:hypothetical protein
MFGTFIIDFQTIQFEPDSRAALEFLTAMQKECQLENAFALDEPVQSAGWSFAKMFLSGQFADEMYKHHSYEIDRSKGKKAEDKFIVWLGAQLGRRGCCAQIKMAPEMKSL